MLLKYESSSPYIHNKPNSTITANFLDESVEYLPFYVYVANDQANNWDSGIVEVYLDDELVVQVNAVNSGCEIMAIDLPYPQFVTLKVPQSDPDGAVFEGWYEDDIKKSTTGRSISFYPGQDYPKIRHITARWISR